MTRTVRPFTCSRARTKGNPRNLWMVCNCYFGARANLSDCTHVRAAQARTLSRNKSVLLPVQDTRVEKVMLQRLSGHLWPHYDGHMKTSVDDMCHGCHLLLDGEHVKSHNDQAILWCILCIANGCCPPSPLWGRHCSQTADSRHESRRSNSWTLARATSAGATGHFN